MKIKINHVAKIEGHTGFMASVIKGDVKSTKFEVQEGIRLIEGILIGRHYADMPIIAQRICGICPVVHNLTAIKAIENAFGIEISEETKSLRKLLEWAQIIHSHALHLFFLSLADFLDIENDLKLVEEYPKESKKAIAIREYGMEIIKVIGGRVVHPLTNEAGGFKKVPRREELQVLIAKGGEILPIALELGEFFKTIKFPNFQRPTEYVSLDKTGEYAIYEGNLISSKSTDISIDAFEKNFREINRPKEVIKEVKTSKNNSYMVGAIARVNNQSKKLRPSAEKYFEGLEFSLPDYNPFHNILCQMTEIIHCIEETIREMKALVHRDLNQALTQKYTVREGIAAAAVEAPRGTLYYKVDIDAKGYIKNINIITPTAQFLSHLEEDIDAYLTQKEVLNLPNEIREKKMRAFIRAYDPCISCAVH